MKYPNFNEEKKLWRKGCKKVVGLDEAGRGPLAGPVVAAAVCFKTGRELFSAELAKNSSLKINDSKKLSPKKREYFYKILTKNHNIKWGIGRVSEKVIDKINILEATKLAMERAVRNLCDRTNFRQVDFLILDGNFRINLPIAQKSIVKADERVFSCAAASIIGKVFRDRTMLRYHKKYPQYGFDRHKGYPTKLHFKMLKKYGPCKIYRKSFKPVEKIKMQNAKIKMKIQNIANLI